MELIKGKQLKKIVDGKLVDVSADAALKDKSVVFIHFSAHWCPPCRSFTPNLKTFYEVRVNDMFKKIPTILSFCQFHFKKQFYNLLALFKNCKKSEKYADEVEVIFVSSDKSETAMITYMNELHGGWLAVEFDSDMAEDVSRQLNITEIPKVIVMRNMNELLRNVDEGGKTWAMVTSEGRSLIQTNKDNPEKAMKEIFEL